ncbi:MAG: hypothetical protein EOR91_23635 [Mesorhizobium sp.]|nr:MAG: hypothetical protein EOR90_27385 [Mesorhizobium sp.]RWQ01061.1 MAG: hypothetical protein EOR91_23635 [Mesorhizobium sp.]
MRGAPAWQGRRSVQHPSSGSTLRADPPSPTTRGEGKGRGAAQTWSDCPSRSLKRPSPNILNPPPGALGSPDAGA